MKVLKPFYYDEFKCIGSECKDSCCIGWSIHIDKKSYSKYKKVKGSFGEKLNDSIKRNRKENDFLSYGKMSLENRKCKMLNEDNLCDLYINMGEDYLCNTCKQYPRVIKKFGAMYERELNLSCPEVARILFSYNGKFEFIMNEEGLSELDLNYIHEGVYNKELYSVLWETRSFLIEVAQFDEIEIWKRIFFIKMISEKVQELIDLGKYDEFETMVNGLKEVVTDYKYIESLDDLKKVNNIKVAFIRGVINRKDKSISKDDKFYGYTKCFNNIFGDLDNLQIESLLNENEKGFSDYMLKYDIMLENYIVYNLYKNLTKVLYSRELNKEIVKSIINYSVVRMLLMARWIECGDKIEENDFIDVIYSYSRAMEHNTVYVDKLYEDIKQNEYDSLAYMTVLVR